MANTSSRASAGPSLPCALEAPAPEEAGCGCAHHRPRPSPAGPEAPAGRWAALVPMLACALCPACLTVYAQLLSFLGVGFSLTESAHQGLLAGAVALSLGVSGWRAWRLRRAGPFVATAVGCALLVLGEVLEENAPLTGAGAAVLLGSMVWERQPWRGLGARRSRPVRPDAAVPPEAQALR